MEGLKIFWNFFKAACQEVIANKKIYLTAFFALVLLGNAETFYPLLGVGEESSVYIILTIVTTLMIFIVLSQVVLIQKKNHGGTGELSFFVPTFLLYNLYYSFLFFLGLGLATLAAFIVYKVHLILAIIVGIIFLILPLSVLIFFSLVPFIAVLDDEVSEGFFKKSGQLVKKNIGLVAWASLINLLMECSALLFSPIQDHTVKAVANFVFSIPDAFLTIAMTITTVKIYYYLKNK